MLKRNILLPLPLLCLQFLLIHEPHLLNPLPRHRFISFLFLQLELFLAKFSVSSYDNEIELHLLNVIQTRDFPICLNLEDDFCVELFLLGEAEVTFFFLDYCCILVLLYEQLRNFCWVNSRRDLFCIGDSGKRVDVFVDVSFWIFLKWLYTRV